MNEPVLPGERAPSASVAGGLPQPGPMAQPASRGIVVAVAVALAVAIAVAWIAGREAQRELRTEVARRLTDADAALAQSRERASDLGNELREAQAKLSLLETRLGESQAQQASLEALYRELAPSRADTARYRDIVVDLENNAMPRLLDGPNAPDDLKLIVGVGPVLERMLHQLGITTYRQIARWSERDIDDFDAKLPEFPGRIRRDAWVTQARELHLSKFGETLPIRER